MEIDHPSHPEHRLMLVIGNTRQFRCDGCKEVGAGERYRCEPCNFNLHKDCALAEGMLVHPLLEGSNFELRREPPGPDEDARLCDACGSKVLGFYYHCAKSDLDLHPCCARLPMEINHGDPSDGITFLLRKEVSHRCTYCRMGGGVTDFWFYRSANRTVYLHVRCVKELALHGGGGGGRGGGGASIRNDDRVMISFVKETALNEYRGARSGNTFERMCTIVATVLRIIVGAIIGDPTVLIGAVQLVVNAFSISTA